MYTYSPLVAPSDQGVIEKQKGVFDRSGTHTDTPDKPLRSDVGSNRGQAGIHQAQDKPQQESCNYTNGTILMRGSFFKTANLTCKKLNSNNIKNNTD